MEFLPIVCRGNFKVISVRKQSSKNILTMQFLEKCSQFQLNFNPYFAKISPNWFTTFLISLWVTFWWDLWKK